jgi:hypothetical protein
MENSRIEEFRLLAMIGKPGRKSAAILELCDEVGRLQKRNGKRAAFLAPVIDDVALYGKELGLSRSDCQAFIDYHQARGWKLGRTQMVDWRAALRTWNDFLSQTSAKYRGEHRYAPEYLRLEFSRWLKIK